MDKIDALEKAVYLAEEVIHLQNTNAALREDLRGAEEQLRDVQVRTANKSWNQVTTAQRLAISDWVSTNQHRFEGSKIYFIKELREVFPYIGLKDAKDQVERVYPVTTDEALNALREKLTNDPF